MKLLDHGSLHCEIRNRIDDIAHKLGVPPRSGQR